MEAFRQGLRDLGYVEGRNVVIEYRDADGKAERLPALAAELVALKVDVIVAPATPAALAAKHATTTIPIVIATAGDPVESGSSPAWRGRAATSRGCPSSASELVGKRLELLKEIVPGMAPGRRPLATGRIGERTDKAC